MSRNAVVVICTRPESKRLPRKAFKPISNVPAIEHILSRLIGAELPVVLAVPTGCTEYDYLITKYQDALKITLFQGNPESPLHRMADCIVGEGFKEKWIVRITHDDILIDQQTMLDLIDQCERTPNCGYGISPMVVEGAGVEVFHRDNLIAAAHTRKEPTEFISYFVKHNPYSVNISHVPRETIRRNYRLTMDYPEDAIVLEIALKNVGAFASLDRIVSFIDQHPYILNINRQPLISVYTCAYNAQEFVVQTMNSVLNNYNSTSVDYEYLFIDDGSTDNTLLRAAQHSKAHNIRFFLNEKNSGLASSSNIAINNARGKYVMRVDADDIVLMSAVMKMLWIMEEDGSGIVYPAYHEIDDYGNIIQRYCSPKENHHAGCALMDKKMINEIRFREGLKHWDSKELYGRIKGKFPIAYLEEPTWYYRRHPTSLSANMTAERENALKEITLG